MEKITISSSLKHRELVRETINNLEGIGVVALFPNLDGGVAKENVDLATMQRIEAEHFEAIDASSGLYVICPGGVVGTLVSVEIGYAYAHQKPVFFSEVPTDLGLQAMAAGYVSLEEVNQIPLF